MGGDCGGGLRGVSFVHSLPYDERTLRFYAEEAPTYTASGAGGVSRHLHAFLDQLPPGVRILELGCGGGRDAQAMLDRGFKVDPTDGVPQMADKARERIGVPVRVMRFDELAAVDEYEAVWANASLLHVPISELPMILRRIHRAMRQSGLHFASYKSGGQEGRDSLQRYFNYPTLEQLKSAYETSGAWSVLSAEEYVGGGYEGGTGPWVAVTLQRI